ncbi:uncharacterized protein LOC113329630 [Papaver somniferum]|uniref:uncharacterized protein LOC113329630 n=1 Tax=Papaver somniferum TaxID=3469 RepID=UPI000E6FD1A7|nr:uncharacterized protein LOC113329630 [Papaver somniferum]
MFSSVACGFGYVRSTNEYKVVRIHYIDYDEGEVEVYTLGSGCGWRAIGSVPYRLDSWSNETGTYANDNIFWILDKEVLAFDLVDEEFWLPSPAPPCLTNGLKVEDKCGLVALGRHLCLYMDKLRMEIWLLTESSDAEETWGMAFDIDYEAVVGSRKEKLEPILLTKKGEIIFLYDESVLYSYDTRTTCLKMISDNPIRDDYFEDVEAIAHLNTFASLEGMGEISKRHDVHPSQGRTPCDDAINELDRFALGDDTDTTPFRFGLSA